MQACTPSMCITSVKQSVRKKLSTLTIYQMPNGSRGARGWRCPPLTFAWPPHDYTGCYIAVLCGLYSYWPFPLKDVIQLCCGCDTRWMFGRERRINLTLSPICRNWIEKTIHHAESIKQQVGYFFSFCGGARPHRPCKNEPSLARLCTATLLLSARGSAWAAITRGQQPLMEMQSEICSVCLWTFIRPHYSQPRFTAPVCHRACRATALSAK